jgi:aquaporin Z
VTRQSRAATATAPNSGGPRGLKGRESDTPKPQEKAPGWHPVEWGCEFIGTAFQLFVGFSIVAVLESGHSAASGALPAWLRLVLIGISFGLLAAGVALSPLGRRSGAHLNPAVTLGFLLRGHTPARDAFGYAMAQVAGAVVAAAAFAAVWPGWAASVSFARTAPQPGLPGWAAATIEAGLTCALLLTVFLMVSSARTARWTPAAVTGVLAALIWAGASHTGASMNPARTVGPDLVSGLWPAVWVYLVGPPAGAAAAVALFRLVGRGRQTLTGKLFHDPQYPSVHATSLPARSQPGSRQRQKPVARAQPVPEAPSARP